MIKISIIIPVYNSENFLRKCLDSICNQTLKDVEIICIDDFSTDNSVSILEEYSSMYNNLKVIKLLENQGAANARNIGIEIAKGEYLGFIDSDDWIDLDFYENLYKKADETNADIIKGSDYKLLWQDGRIEVDRQNEKIKKSKLNFWSQFTTAIYKRDFIIKNNIKFPTGMLIGEDPVFATKAAILSNKIEVIDNAQYYYNRRAESLNSVIYNQEKIDNYEKYIKIISDFVSKQNLPKNENMFFFERLINDVNENKKSRAYSLKLEKQFDDMLNYIKIKRSKYPIRVLFDAGVFALVLSHKEDRRGIYWVSYNLLKKFMSDKRFEVTLWLEAFYGVDILEDIKKEFNLPVVFSHIMLGKSMNYKKLPNKNFNPANYDIYFNSTVNFQLKPNPYLFRFFIFHDTIPLLEEKWFELGGSIAFFKFYRQLNKYDYGFSVSESSKNDFKRFLYNIDSDKITVSPIATAQNFIPDYDRTKLKKVLLKLNVPEEAMQKYIFYFGSVNDPRKNTLLNIKCFIEFIKRHNIKDLYFYLGGCGANDLEKILCDKLGSFYTEYSKYIIKLGYIKKEDVNILYSNSLFFSFIPEYEGFGMPPLEAMQAGTPVICADNSSLPEVVGDAAIKVNAYDEEGIINAFEKFYYNEDLRKEYIKLGFERAKLFSWNKTFKIISDKIIDAIMDDKEIK